VNDSDLIHPAIRRRLEELELRVRGLEDADVARGPIEVEVDPPAAWEAFTIVCADGSRPRTGDTIVRPLQGDAYNWPDGEVHNGIAGWRIDCHGDDPAGAFVTCWGRSASAVCMCLDRLMQFVKSGGTTALYP
jgi:hypothetical protein